MHIEPLTVRQQVVRAMVAAITSGQFEPGMRLVERDLCQMMGVSRPSVREALRELEAAGLIANVPNKGPVVVTLTRADARAIYQVRGALESLAVRLFTTVASAAQVASLQAALDAVSAAYAVGAVEGNLAAKNRFYGVLLEGCGNRLVGDMLSSLNTRVTLLRRLSLGSADRLTESLAELRTMVDAIQRRDADAAVAATLAHVQHAADVAIRALPEDALPVPSSSPPAAA